MAGCSFDTQWAGGCRPLKSSYAAAAPWRGSGSLSPQAEIQQVLLGRPPLAREASPVEFLAGRKRQPHGPPRPASRVMRGSSHVAPRREERRARHGRRRYLRNGSHDAATDFWVERQRLYCSNYQISRL
ncbi:Hypothetical predicted protein [Podarcis lilfordi]|uniref:Uncharacterized protein n=1 Tax=Podarcis lilfordi TaxID=74358 RepID=A0AA35KHU9_9SAUR|nr:Hypothetical predicted protein [Podarcis lilfordi]